MANGCWIMEKIRKPSTGSPGQHLCVTSTFSGESPWNAWGEPARPGRSTHNSRFTALRSPPLIGSESLEVGCKQESTSRRSQALEIRLFLCALAQGLNLRIATTTEGGPCESQDPTRSTLRVPGFPHAACPVSGDIKAIQTACATGRSRDQLADEDRQPATDRFFPSAGLQGGIGPVLWRSQ